MMPRGVRAASRWALAALAVIGFAAAAANPATAFAPFGVGLLGDTPYSDWERTQLPQMLRAMADAGVAFAVHDGDIKSGASACSDAVYRTVLDVFQAAPVPLVFVPGDNDWTDCHRTSNGGHDPQERLNRLRELFFQGDTSLGQRPIALTRQSRDPRFAAYRENVRWEMQGVLFVGLNLPGSHNNYHGTSRYGGPSSEYTTRGAANRAWLAQAFARARQQQLAGVMVIIQANPELEAASAGQPKPGYRDFIDQLRAETEAFAGQVVLVHGDTHSHKIDQPLLDASARKVLPNFTRVETYGYPFMGWVLVRVNANDPQVFRFEPRRWQPLAGD